MSLQYITSRHQQQGMATLVVATLMLVSMTLVILFTANSILVEQRISANDYRSTQSFEVGEAGIEHAFTQLALLGRAQLSDIDSDGDGLGEVSLDTNGDGSADTSTLSGSFSSGSYNVVMHTPSPGDFSHIRVTASGSNDDGSASSINRVDIQWTPLLPNPPPAPLVARTTVNLGGDVTITNLVTALTIWSGGNTALTGSATTAPVVGAGSDSGGNGPDVVDTDTALGSLSGDLYFENFFQASKAEIREKSTVHTGAGNYSDILDGVTGTVLWIDGAGGELRFNSNTTIGSPTSPVIFIGENFTDLQANGSLTIYGLVYIAGDWYNSGGGGLTVYGAAISEGSISGTGTPDVNYNPSILSNLDNFGTYAKIPGSWRDF